jgi:hypothetical protein
MHAMAYNTDIERLNYYEGEFLGAADFEAEQEYHRDMRRRHNLAQHTWGIVSGLDLAQPVNGASNANGAEVDVYLQPGMAVDGFGREIVVLGQAQLTPAMFAAFYNPSSNAQPIPIYVWIAYQEQLLNPPSDACSAANTTGAYGRVGETYTLTVTGTATPPPDSGIVVDGTQVTTPTSATTSSSGTVLDPPPITLPLDGSVPYQEFSTDDSTLVWWLPLGRVMWDSYNQVFLQLVQGDPVKSAISAAFGREYAGNVSATTYVPAGQYTVVDRNSPYPLQPNDPGVQMEVAGSLQVDVHLVAGGAIDPTVSFPLTIYGSDQDQDLIQFRDPTGATTWYINQQFDGKTAGLNIGQGGVGAAKPTDGRLFILGDGTGNVGVGTAAPQQNLSVNAGINLDQAGANAGTLNPGLTFGSKSTEGISSNRGNSGNKGGLDFYTRSISRMSIANNGNVGVATTGPVSAVQLKTLTALDEGTTSAGAWANFGSNAYYNGGWTRIDTGKAGVNFHLNADDGAGQEFRFHRMESDGSSWGPTGNVAALGSQLSYLLAPNVGIATAAPQQGLSVNMGLNIDQENTNPGGSLPTGINKALTFGSTSGEGIGSCRVIGGANRFGLDFYTDFAVRMNINNGGSISMANDLTVGTALTVNGARTYLIGVDGVGNHWIMGGGSAEPQDNAIGINAAAKTLILGGTSGWSVNVAGYLDGVKVGYVADRFVNRNGATLERGDVVVVHSNPSSQCCDANARVPLVEVELSSTEMDTRVCGIVDEPVLPEARIGSADRAGLKKAQVGLMVTLGAYAFCKVDADPAPIAPGDLLVTSSTPGYAQKIKQGARARPGAIIGKALGACSSGKGLIPILFSHQ